MNLNKVALLRNSRGGNNPSPAVAAQTCIDGGVQGVTLHWRQDDRHTRKQDVIELCALTKDHGVEFNLEGDSRLDLVELALHVKPTQFTLVPVTPGEITSDHGWDLPRQHNVVSDVISRINDSGIRSAIFVDPVASTMEMAAATGTQRVEIYTEPYARGFERGDEGPFLALQASAAAAAQAGLGVNAGHDLNLPNIPRLVREVPQLLEASIGHALVADALYLGLEETLRRYLAACRGEIVDAPRTQ